MGNKIQIMLGTFIQIDTKEFLRGIFDTVWWVIWTFKWYWLAAIVILLIPRFLVRFFGRKVAAIILSILLILAIAAFFIWLYM